MTRAAASIARRKKPTPPKPRSPEPRPGWVYDLVVAILTASRQTLTAQEIIHQATHVRGQRIPPSSIRNCLRTASTRNGDVIERVSYGRYRLRLDRTC